MEYNKVWLITDDNGRYYDILVGDDNLKQTVLTTKYYIEKDNEIKWVKLRIVQLPLEGKIHRGHTNIITTIKLNNIPIRAIANNFYNLTEIVEGYMSIEDEYRKYNYHTEFIKIN